MAVVASTITEYLNAIGDPSFRLGLNDVPATPWYLGQADTKGTLLPAFYQPSTKIDPELEREMLRDYKVSSVEFVSPRGWSDAEILIGAHMNALPTRILEWSANPLVALFLAVESLGGDNGRVWILNPWRMNFLAAKMSFVPMTETDIFKKYVVKLEGADTLPEALPPMAFRPPRSTRNYNLQNIFWTVHGKTQTPIEKQDYFLTRIEDIVTSIEINKDKKKEMMKALHNLGVTRSNLFPGPASLTRTLAYRYSANYVL